MILKENSFFKPNLQLLISFVFIIKICFAHIFFLVKRHVAVAIFIGWYNWCFKFYWIKDLSLKMFLRIFALTNIDQYIIKKRHIVQYDLISKFQGSRLILKESRQRTMQKSTCLWEMTCFRSHKKMWKKFEHFLTTGYYYFLLQQEFLLYI